MNADRGRSAVHDGWPDGWTDGWKAGWVNASVFLLGAGV